MATLTNPVKAALIGAVGAVLGGLVGALAPMLFRDPQMVRIEREILELRRILRVEAQLSPEDLQAVENLGAEQMFALFAAAGGSGSLGKTGKTRSLHEINALKAQLEQLTADMPSSPPLGGTSDD